MRPGGSFLSLTYMAGERVIPGYGGGMSSAKAALEADTRTLAFEAGRRWGVRVNAISAGPWASRAASAIGFIDTMIKYTAANSPLPRPIDAADVGSTAAFLCSPLAPAITGSVVYVDNGYHAMGMAVVESEGELRLSDLEATASISWASTASSNGFSIKGRGVLAMNSLSPGEVRSPVVMISEAKRSGRCSASQSCSSTPV